MTKCSIPTCNYPLIAGGLCSRHYQAKRKYGDPLVVKQKQHHGKTLQERFDIYTSKKSDGCWEWVGSKDPHGYGRLNIDGTPILAHRLSYKLHYGDFPQEKIVCHKCDTPKCVNPEHLFLGTYQDNMDDMERKGRARKVASLGEKHGNAVLTDELVREIRDSIEQTPVIANRLGVSRTTIYDVRSRKIWKHIP